MKLFNRKVSLKAVRKDGKKEYVPTRTITVCGISYSYVPKEWKEIQKRINAERGLGLDNDSTLTHIKAFNNKTDPNPANPYYNY